MKIKKIFGAALIAATAFAAGWYYQQNKQSVELSDLALANVEALAGNEERDENCRPCNNELCTFVVSTPSGNRVEDHYNYTEVH